MLRSIDRNLWVQEQPFSYLGLEVGTRMTVIRIEDGSLAVISPIDPDEATVEQLNDLGQVAYIVAPNLYHHLYVTPFQARYPEAELLAPRGLERKRPDLNITRFLDEAAGAIAKEIEYLPFKGFATFTLDGSPPVQETLFFHQDTQTLILTDAAFRFDETYPFLTQLATRILGGYKTLRPTWFEKVGTQDKEAVRQSVQKVLQWDFQRAIVAHGSIVETNAKEELRAGYQWFLDADSL